ncbi:histidinol-phosphate transaminase [Bengtsoniella intestinalis]|uniref:histidinol-phosphate transaminase n=1 Tax=Bengtsoniella intestinalis TaxID=3073143 RepID=UPI00391F5A4B
MSRFLTAEASILSPYTPGEQPQDQQYVKLNTNESPFPPSPRVVKAISKGEIQRLNLYPDPDCTKLVTALANYYDLKSENIVLGNGSDEILAFAFRAFCGKGKPVAYSDITYGFYKVWAKLYDLESIVVPLRDGFELNVDDYMDLDATIVIANPNAPTGRQIPIADIQRLLEKDPDRVVIVDEAYIDFGGESCLPLLYRYDNLLIVQTMSKSRSLAGGRVGYGLGSPALISDITRIKYSFNPYNLNRLSIAAGVAAVEDDTYFKACTGSVMAVRSWTVSALEELGFTVVPSVANFIFATHDTKPAKELYQTLKSEGVLVRWFDAPKIDNHCRITIGSMEQMEILVETLERILEGE